MPDPRALHTCEVGSFPPHEGYGDQIITPDQLVKCGRPATLHQVGGKDYWMCDACASMNWTAPEVRSTEKMKLNPEPLGIVADNNARWAGSLSAWNRTATRADRLRVWVATGGTEAEFDENYPASGGDERVSDDDES